ncbi:MAG: selenocysteine-specific translation elongation factor [Planctomycetaceae bacterium]
MSGERRPVILGTAGHIDHGKTRLVAALTGIDTHRLPEEKRRGISIDLGFANWQTDDFVFGVVDVPGHRRFVRNMVAGATGIDIAVLVIAADDSVMPQTREHLQIMQWLGISCGLVVITKCDLVDSDMIELVRLDVAELTRNTFLQHAEIVCVSSESGDGIENLRSAIVRAAGQLPKRTAQWPVFRLPVDRSFSLAGHGTVVTGSAISGQVEAGDRLILQPEQLEVRVRSVQTHHRAADSAEAGQRTAVNLASIRPEQVPRGVELVTPGWFRPTQRLLAQLDGLNETLIARGRLNAMIHIGTAEIPCRIVIKSDDVSATDTDQDEIVRSQSSSGGLISQIVLQQAVIASHGQRFILRRLAPAATIGGGLILDPLCPARLRNREAIRLATGLQNLSAIERVSSVISLLPMVPDDLRETAIRSGCSLADVESALQELLKIGRLVRIGSKEPGLLVHRERLQGYSRTILSCVRKEIAAHPPGRSRSRRLLQSACHDLLDEQLTASVFELLIHDKKLVPLGPNLAVAGSEHQLTKKQSMALNQILEQVRKHELVPPTRKELADSLNEPLSMISAMLDIAVEDGLLIRVDESLHFTPDAIEKARIAASTLLKQNGPATIAQLRDAWTMTRKHAVPLAQYFDSVGMTIREGDLRVAGPNLLQSRGDFSGEGTT